jgi:hypothetical protein
MTGYRFNFSAEHFCKAANENVEGGPTNLHHFTTEHVARIDAFFKTYKRLGKVAHSHADIKTSQSLYRGTDLHGRVIVELAKYGDGQYRFTSLNGDINFPTPKFNLMMALAEDYLRARKEIRRPAARALPS